MLSITCEYPRAGRDKSGERLGNSETKTGQSSQTRRKFRTILQIKLLVKDSLSCPGNGLIFYVTKYGMKLYLCQDTHHSSQFFGFFIKFFCWKYDGNSLSSANKHQQ